MCFFQKNNAATKQNGNGTAIHASNRRKGQGRSEGPWEEASKTKEERGSKASKTKKKQDRAFGPHNQTGKLVFSKQGSGRSAQPCSQRSAQLLFF
jgi:hypothetical protein